MPVGSIKMSMRAGRGLTLVDAETIGHPTQRRFELRKRHLAGGASAEAAFEMPLAPVAAIGRLIQADEDRHQYLLVQDEQAILHASVACHLKGLNRKNSHLNFLAYKSVRCLALR